MFPIKKIVIAYSIIFATTLAATDLVNIDGLRIWQSPENIMLIFDNSAKASYEIEELINPHRIVIRIKAKLFKGKIDSSRFEDSDIRNIRFGKHGEYYHFVIDLQQSIPYKYYELDPYNNYGHRLVFELGNRDLIPDSKQSREQEPPPTAITFDNITKLQRDVIIVIDPGHGGDDPGALAKGEKILEKNIAFSIAEKLQRQFNNIAGFKAVLTRTSDYYIALERRAKLAHINKADAFISIHADSFTTNAAYGASIYTLSNYGATSDSAKRLAERENLADLVGGIELVKLKNRQRYLQDTLLDLSLNATLESSIELGSHLLPLLKKVTKLHKKKVEQADFVVLRSPDIPSILIECGFISNNKEAKRLTNKQFQSKLSHAIATGVQQYFIKQSIPGTYLYYQQHKDSITVDVVKGDSLSKISEQYNVSIAKIKKVNKLKNNTIRIGQTILIPLK